MTIDELIAACDAPSPHDGTIPEHIYLTVPKKYAPNKFIRLAGNTGPLGRVCTAKVTATGFNVVAIFKRAEVRRFALSLKDTS